MSKNSLYCGFKALKEKQIQSSITSKPVKFRLNKSSKNLLKFLERQELIKILTLKQGLKKDVFKILNLHELKFFKTQAPIKLKQIGLIKKKYLKNDLFRQGIIRTSKGYKTVNQCLNKKIGGFLIGSYTKFKL